MSANGSRSIVIVTGANTGVGFGICQRLLFELSSKSPELANEPNCNGLTIILACRSRQRAEAARDKLFDIADEQVLLAKRLPGYDGQAEGFRRNLHIMMHTVDLANIQSVFCFADEISQNYPYVSHLICNAGVICFSKIIWPLALQQFLTNPVAAFTTPKYLGQRIGDLTQDRLGRTWQCNVFGHYVLFRALEPMMVKHTGSRVVWISSHESSSEFYDPKDWQLINSGHSYQCSKYQMNMMSLYLDREATRGQLDDAPAVRHFIAYPGVVGTNIVGNLLGAFTSLLLHASFYIARFLGSTNHPIDIFKAAISAVYLSLTPLACIPTVSAVPNLTDNKQPIGVGTVYMSKTDWWGCEFVGTTELIQSLDEETQTKELLKNCDRLINAFCNIDGRCSHLARTKN